MIKRSFASDNNAGVHPEVIEAIRAANEGHVIAYGDDPFTARAVKLFQKHFGRHVAVYFVFGGTGANVLGLKAITRSHQAIICAETAHVFRRPTASFASIRSNRCCTASASNTTCSRL
jgi:threonine aldolase